MFFSLVYCTTIALFVDSFILMRFTLRKGRFLHCMRKELARGRFFVREKNSFSRLHKIVIGEWKRGMRRERQHAKFVISRATLTLAFVVMGLHPTCRVFERVYMQASLAGQVLLMLTLSVPFGLSLGCFSLCFTRRGRTATESAGTLFSNAILSKEMKKSVERVRQAREIASCLAYAKARSLQGLRRCAHSLRRTVSRSRANAARQASSFTAAPSHDDSGGDGGGSDDGDGQSGDDHHHVTFAVGLSACGLFVLDSAKQNKFIHGSGVGLAACCGVVNGRFFVPFRGVEVSA